MLLYTGWDGDNTIFPYAWCDKKQRKTLPYFKDQKIVHPHCQKLFWQTARLSFLWQVQGTEII